MGIASGGGTPSRATASRQKQAHFSEHLEPGDIEQGLKTGAPFSREGRGVLPQ